MVCMGLGEGEQDGFGSIRETDVRAKVHDVSFYMRTPTDGAMYSTADCI